MSRKWVGLIVLLVILAGAAAGWAQNPTNLTVIRKADNTIWKRTCNGTSSCSDWVKIGGKFAVQPTLTWDESIQKYILVGIGNDKTSIWRSTFEGDGTWNNDWTPITGSSGGSPSPVAIAGGELQPQTIAVACPGQSLQSAINAAPPGSTINVTGICEENVVIREEKERLLIDGGNAATLSGNSSSPTVTISGAKGIKIRNFWSPGGITGGSGGVQIKGGGVAAIDRNDISNSGSQGGIVVVGVSFAVITDNNIHDNTGWGIQVLEGSSVRIGFDSVGDSGTSPNTIEGNGEGGILVTRTSNARIAGNTIADNTGDGIQVTRLSQADIASNIINANSANGISTHFNGGVQLGENSGTGFLSQPNITSSNNGQYGISCSMGAYVRGHLGSTDQINGTSGQTSITATCPQDLEP
jgi:parallel beta-helix repeat protein